MSGGAAEAQALAEVEELRQRVVKPPDAGGRSRLGVEFGARVGPRQGRDPTTRPRTTSTAIPAEPGGG